MKCARPHSVEYLLHIANIAVAFSVLSPSVLWLSIWLTTEKYKQWIKKMGQTTYSRLLMEMTPETSVLQTDFWNISKSILNESFGWLCWFYIHHNAGFNMLLHTKTKDKAIKEKLINYIQISKVLFCGAKVKGHHGLTAVFCRLHLFDSQVLPSLRPSCRWLRRFCLVCSGCLSTSTSTTLTVWARWELRLTSTLATSISITLWLSLTWRTTRSWSLWWVRERI